MPTTTGTTMPPKKPAAPATSAAPIAPTSTNTVPTPAVANTTDDQAYTPDAAPQTPTDSNQPLPLADRLNIMMNVIGGGANTPTLTTGSNSAVADGQPNLMTNAVGTPSTTSAIAQDAYQSSLKTEQQQNDINTQSVATPASGPIQPAGNPSAGQTKANQQLGQQKAASYGWDKGDQWNALNNVAMRESGWNANAANPTSNARGIAQKITGWDGSYKQGEAGPQIDWMLNYIKGRYGTPAAAWAHEQQYGWY